MTMTMTKLMKTQRKQVEVDEVKERAVARETVQEEEEVAEQSQWKAN